MTNYRHSEKNEESRVFLFIVNCPSSIVNYFLIIWLSYIHGGVFMVKRKNYDSPFDREELENLDRQPLLEEEQLQESSFNERESIYPPIGS